MTVPELSDPLVVTLPADPESVTLVRRVIGRWLNADPQAAGEGGMSDGDALPVVAPRGELDLMRAPELRKELMSAADNRDAGLVIDLSDATYLDSAVVNVLFEVVEGSRRGRSPLPSSCPRATSWSGS